MHTIRATSVALLAIALSTVACARSGPSTARTPASDTPAASITPERVNQLAGKWRGWWVDTSGAALPLEVDVDPAGTYRSRVGSLTGAGTFKIVDGKVVTTGQLSGPGAPVSGRSAVVTLAGTDTRPVLVGQGRTDAGPYSFQMTRE